MGAFFFSHTVVGPMLLCACFNHCTRPLSCVLRKILCGRANKILTRPCCLCACVVLFSFFQALSALGSKIDNIPFSLCRQYNKFLYLQYAINMFHSVYISCCELWGVGCSRQALQKWLLTLRTWELQMVEQAPCLLETIKKKSARAL